MTHPATVYSLSTRLLHWSMAFCFIGAIVLAYFVIWVLGHDHPQRLPVLNLHWVLGLLVGLFVVPSFKDTALFAWISQTWNLSWEAFEKPFDAVHRVVGLWLSTSVVLLHALAAGYHQWVRRDGTLERMLGRRQRR
ncbi:cytochrome b [Pseudomonas aeruginosa]